jgi:flagellar hook assembly protein FlgD
MADGRHTIKVKAWDMNNNSGEGVVNFEVLNGKVVTVQNLMNYPNPFSSITHFVFDHNQPNEDLTVSIKIMNTTGMLVADINEQFSPNGSRSEILWDGTDNNGTKLPSGVYVYEIILTTKDGIQAAAHEKIVILR